MIRPRVTVTHGSRNAHTRFIELDVPHLKVVASVGDDGVLDCGEVELGDERRG